VVLVTNGIRSNAAAIVAGLSQTLLGGVALVYLPKVFGNFVAIAFGLGAIAIVKFLTACSPSKLGGCAP